MTPNERLNEPDNPMNTCVPLTMMLEWGLPLLWLLVGTPLPIMPGNISTSLNAENRGAPSACPADTMV